MAVLTGTLVDRVAKIITRYSMLRAGDRVGVAVSGGADSVALLHILHRLAPQFQASLLVVHLNHQLRGEESDGDEAFVRSLADELGLPIEVKRRPVGPGNLEEAAREDRRAFFAAARQKHGLARVALGHTQSDQAETVLFRLLRGSGLAGLAGMRPVTEDGLIRPLLTVLRNELRAWAEAEGLRWREDSSNESLRFTRNKLRRETIPMLREAYNPSLEPVLAGMADLAQTEEDYWNEQIEAIYSEITKRTGLGSFFQIDQIWALHPAVRRRLIRRAIQAIRGDLRSIDLPHVDRILEICSSSEGHNRVLLPGVDALRSFETLLLTRPGELAGRDRHYSFELKLGEARELPFGAGHICIERVKSGASFCVNFKLEESKTEIAYLDPLAFAEGDTPPTLRVRSWEPGDELRRPGHAGVDKIKTLFQEFRVLLWERRHWPVLMVGSKIVWARRFGAAWGYGTERKDDVLRLTFWAD